MRIILIKSDLVLLVAGGKYMCSPNHATYYSEGRGMCFTELEMSILPRHDPSKIL